MSSAYVIFEHLAVQDANCIAGFTYGFPAITHFLGFGHALSRKLNQYQLQGCAVVCHQHQIHAYQPNGFGDYVFAQSKNPPLFKKHATTTPPIIEEGKMNMCVSLIMECPNFTLSRQYEIDTLKQKLKSLALQHRLAGGSIQDIKSVHLLTEKNNSDERKEQTRQIKRWLLPGFVLIDRTDLLAGHYQQVKQTNLDAELIDAWLDFFALKYQAQPLLNDNEQEPNEQTKAEWIRIDKPAKGYLVPITNGYKAITPVCSPGEVANTRNPEYPFCFVEAAHSIGEWRSLHRIQDISEMLWQYQYEEDWYLCQQGKWVDKQPNEIPTESINDDPEDDFLSSL
ncbi:type I-F CRISPR-associated protein Csy2 [Nitrosomonas sp. Is37]|uniref:type I-F CRISPR-associated protein Csy2 n=1 Tax=Nitrosomonas sp. Is37 TaxID=3080535 RepID=UPI00294B4EE6|nr:type I-F CRISPR-associated protein Csy2 [Nitrosomonas sp. Is37]MDV6343163.1 type I-F CRISPR-associated protein Csy2 [Nitrosomonas sp. Is37]